jgi:hypothetical protein
MSSNYDMEPANTPPWWPGLIAMLFLAAFWLAYLFVKY